MAITNEARAALNGLDDVDWSELRHPYGAAADVPDHLRGLLASPDADEATDAGVFFAAYFVCQGVHFDDAAPVALPFMLRLLAAPGVSSRGPLMSSVLSMLRISVRSAENEADAAVRRACLEVFEREAPTIVELARFLDGHGFDDAIDAIVVAVAPSIRAHRAVTRLPRRIRTMLGSLGEDAREGTAHTRLEAWARRSSRDLWTWLSEAEESVPHEWGSSEGNDSEDEDENEDDGSDAVHEPSPPAIDWEARDRAECAETSMPSILEADRAPLTDLYVSCRDHETLDWKLTLSSVDVRVGLRAPAELDGAPLARGVLLRVLLPSSGRPIDLPMDARIETDAEGRWLSMLIERPAKFTTFRAFCKSCAFLVAKAQRG
jgi:hypothetical protein